MKLQELDTLKQQDKAQQVLENRLGHSVSFENLSLYESRHMLLRVRGLLNEHRSSTAFHSSERNPAYLKLLMIESGLKGRLKEVAPVVPGQPAAGAVPIDTKDPKVQAAMKKSQTGQTLNPEEQKLVGAVAASAMQKESRLGRRRLRESELQSAQVVLAAQDMIDRIQKMLEEVSEMQFKDLPALTDSIKNDMGIEQATQFQSASAAALTQLLQGLQQGKTQMEAAQGTLTGQAPVVPGQDPMAAPADPAVDPDMDAELDVDADIEPADDEEEPTPLGGAGLGRERR
jgi:urease gamma subunit